MLFTTRLLFYLFSRGCQDLYNMFSSVHLELEGGLRRVNHAAVLIGGSIYSFGGYCAGENYQQSRPIDVHALNTQTFRKKTREEDLWQLVVLNDNSLCPFQRCGHTVVAHDGRIYLFGGKNDCSACNTLYCFDPITMSWSAPQVTGDVPPAFEGHSACVVNDKMFIFGGYIESTESHSQDLYCLDLKSMIWVLIRHIGMPPSHRDYHTAVVMGHKIFVFGGRGAEIEHSQKEMYCNKVHYLDTLTNEWVQLESSGCIPKGRRGHSAFVYDGKMMIFGGYNGNDDSYFNDLYTFDPVTCVWARFYHRGKSPCPRRRQSCCLIGNQVILFGGTSPMSPNEQGAISLDHNLPHLQEHNDLHVLDFSCQKLTSLCLLSVVKYDLDYSHIPRTLINDLTVINSENNITHSQARTGP